MCIYAYMRISTSEQRELQTFNRQEKAIQKWAEENQVIITERKTYKDDASGKNFNRPQWQELESDLKDGDTIVFKELSRFTRECDNGYSKYMELLNRGINLVFIDNLTISTDYIKQMMEVASSQTNRIARKSLNDTIELLLIVELDRVEKERETIVKRIKDGIKASEKKSGRVVGNVDKLSKELLNDIQLYLNDRNIKAIDIINKHNISRNTFKKYCKLYQEGKLQG